jgi:hypothetical protein
MFGDVGDPQLVRVVPGKPTVYQIGDNRLGDGRWTLGYFVRQQTSGAKWSPLAGLICPQHRQGDLHQVS